MLSPAKLNLFLAVTGRRPDGFHDLVSVVAPLAWGDELVAEPSAGPDFTLACDDPAVPTGDDNLILRAARAFRAAAPAAPILHFRLTKRIPMGAGLGGGSSNAATALRLLQEAAGAPLAEEALRTLAAGIGSDCPLFLRPRPLIMRGRGERLEELPPGAAARISGRRVFVFKPDFGIGTPWAYRSLAERAPRGYLSPAAAEERLSSWSEYERNPLERLLFNSLEIPAFAKFPALPAAIDRLRAECALESRLTGSGSALFALRPPAGGPSNGEFRAAIDRSLGPSTFLIETSLTPW